jgi:hypothetical protein
MADTATMILCAGTGYKGSRYEVDSFSKPRNDRNNITLFLQSSQKLAVKLSS